MPFSIFQQPDHVLVTENENFFQVSIHDINAALNEESRKAPYSNVDAQQTNTEWIQLCSPVLLYLCKVSGMLTPRKCEGQSSSPFLFCFKVLSFSEN